MSRSEGGELGLQTHFDILKWTTKTLRGKPDLEFWTD